MKFDFMISRRKAIEMKTVCSFKAPLKIASILFGTRKNKT